MLLLLFEIIQLIQFFHIEKMELGTLFGKITQWHFHRHQRRHFAPKNFKFHAVVKKCHFGNFFMKGWDDRALLVQPSKINHGISTIHFILLQVSMNIKKDWKAKLESVYSFMLKYSKITVCETMCFDLAPVCLCKSLKRAKQAQNLKFNLRHKSLEIQPPLNIYV